METASAQRGRHLTWPWFVGVVIVYLAIIQVLGLLIGVDTGDADSQFPTTEAIVRDALIPIGASIVFAVAVTTWLGWWGEVLHYRRPVRPWVRFVPISMLVVAVAGVNYGHLADQTAGLVLCLVLLAVFVGFGEELMFRGLGVHVFARAGFTEGKVALYSSIVFGLAHVSNAIGAGPQALFQAAVVSTSGYFFYLCLRVGGVLWLPMLVHGLWDFSLISNEVGSKADAAIGPVLIILLQVVLIVVLLIRRHKIEPSTASSSTA